MKQLTISALILIAAFSSKAQPDTTSIEQYCQVIATPVFLSKKVSIDIDFGEEKSFWKDDRLRAYNGKIRKFNSIIDALNFMGKEGWVFINAYPVQIGNTAIYHFAFKKLVLKKDLQENEVVRF